ncbi:MAG: hypothetical protein CSA50_07840 [Gammaproteobacteria bacterium]|nr:MAG: hypothetical protein CSA50_07840 [Gammaproteobacteria bacterium]
MQSVNHLFDTAFGNRDKPSEKPSVLDRTDQRGVSEQFERRVIGRQDAVLEFKPNAPCFQELIHHMLDRSS